MDARRSSFEYEDLLACGRGELFHEGPQLPLPPMLMFDRISEIAEAGGEYGKGLMRAALKVRPDLWFFPCHFKGDPVMPGCLGLDALWQMVGFFLGWLGAHGRGRALGVGEVKLTGQVLPNVKEIIYGVEAPRVDAVAFWVMGSTFAINLAVVLYERRAGRRLSSEILLADAHHTTSDLATSLTVIAALVGVRFGYSWLDPAAALVVAGFIAYACWEIFRDTSRILGDRIVIDETSIRAVVQTVPDVLGCHRIRTRGSVDHVFLDLHVWMDGRMPLHEAHRVSHVVKDRLMARFPEIKDAVIHLEPPPGE